MLKIIHFVKLQSYENYDWKQYSFLIIKYNKK